MTHTPATVDIATATPSATTIPIRQLHAGVTLWTVMGIPESIDKVTHFKRGCRVYRTDGTVEWFDYQHPLDGAEQTITVGLPD